MKNLEELLATAKLSALLDKKEEQEGKKVLWVLAIVGAVAVIAGIAAAVYHYLSPDYLDDIEDEFEDDFFEDEDDDDEEEEEEPVEEAAEEESSEQ